MWSLSDEKSVIECVLVLLFSFSINVLYYFTMLLLYKILTCTW